MISVLAAYIALVGGTVYPMNRPPIENCTLLIEDGRIVELGPDVMIPADSQRIDVSGSIITPGFVDAWTQLGLVEISGVADSNDGQSGRTDVTAANRAADSYNPDSSVIPIQRAHGVTTALVAPSGSVISGTAAVFDLDGARPVVADAGLVVRLGGQSGGARGAVFAWVRSVFTDALAFVSNRRLFERNEMRTLAVSRLDLEAVAPVAQGKRKVFVRVDRRADILAVLRWAKSKKLHLVLVGAREAWLEAKRLAADGVGVILDPTSNDPGGFDRLRSRADAARILLAAGVRVAVSTFSTHNVRKLRQWAGNAVREGVDYMDALRTITAHPAQLLGLKRRGVLSPGRIANLVVWSDDPLELSSRAELVFVQGRRLEMGHRQQKLFERYRRINR
ncbi:MAG: amidohydrolase family protein [Bradymonadia bacterium]